MNHIITKTQYLSALTYWSNCPNRPAADHIIYNAIRGFDLKRGFTPITSPIKLSNGAYDWQGFNTAREDAQHIVRLPYIWPKDQQRFDTAYTEKMKALSKKYGFEFTPELMEQLREVLK